MRIEDRPDVLVVVGRSTFDLASAEPLVAAAVAAVDPATVIAADGAVLQSDDHVSSSLATVPTTARHLVVLFASFADSRLAAAAVDHFEHVDAIVLWSLPEEWTGGRLLRNSLCGANLAAHRLVAEGHRVAGMHENPGLGTERSIEQAITRANARVVRHSVPKAPVLSDVEGAAVHCAVEQLRSTRLGLVGASPAGFEPCEVEPRFVPDGVEIERVPVEALFEASDRSLSEADVQTVNELRDIAGIDHVHRGVIEQVAIEQSAIEQSVALQSGAERLAERRDWNALAIRCWPECFDEWHGAACAAMALLNERGIPAACEADALGAVSMRVMQSLSGQPTFLADLVEVDFDRDRLVFWHCGVAPRTMADGHVELALHPNRKLPLVFDFALAKAPVTLLRVSKSGGGLSLAIGEGRLTGAQPFEGTSGVVQLATSAQTVVDAMIEEGLEHHFVLAIGHHRRLLDAVATELELPVIHLT